MAIMPEPGAGFDHFTTPDSARAVIKLNDRAHLRVTVYRDPDMASITFDDLNGRSEWSVSLTHHQLRTLRTGIAMVLAEKERVY